MIENAVLAERDVFDKAKLDDICRVNEGRGANFLDCAVISDIHLVGAINGLGDKAGNEDNRIEGKDNQAKISDCGVVDVKDGV